MKNLILKYGIISGLIGLLCFFTAYFLGIPTRGNRYFIIVVLVILYLPSFLSIRKYKQLNNNEVTFLKALWMGFASGIIASLVFAIYTATYYYLINPDFAASDLRDTEILFSKQMGYKGAELISKMEAEKEKLSAWNESITKFKGSFIFCTIVAFANALFFCKKD
jgi:hypothetical protein